MFRNDQSKYSPWPYTCYKHAENFVLFLCFGGSCFLVFVFVETGFLCVALVGLELTEICLSLPLPLQVLGLHMCVTMPRCWEGCFVLFLFPGVLCFEASGPAHVYQVTEGMTESLCPTISSQTSHELSSVPSSMLAQDCHWWSCCDHKWLSFNIKQSAWLVRDRTLVIIFMLCSYPEVYAHSAVFPPILSKSAWTETNGIDHERGNRSRMRLRGAVKKTSDSDPIKKQTFQEATWVRQPI